MAHTTYEELWKTLEPAPEPEIHAREARYWSDFAKRYPEVREPFVQEARQEGVQRGLQQGLQPLLHLYERRLKRPLSEAEHRTLCARLDTLGPDRLGDVVLDLPPEALAAWLANPDAT